MHAFNMTKRTWLLIATGVVAVLAAWGTYTTQKNDIPSNISIVTTLFPLYDIAKTIGGDHVSVSLLLPPGAEPHDFEPTPSDLVRIAKADVFIYTGKDMEPWAESIISKLPNPKPTILNASENTVTTPVQGENNGHIDPHIWLNFSNDIEIANDISALLSKKDPIHANTYQINASEYIKKLSMLDTLYRTTLKTCKNKNFIQAGHNAFGYLAQRYNLQYLSAQGMSPEIEPTPAQLAKITETVKQNHVTTIFSEELIEPRIAEVIARETGAKIEQINAAHNLSAEEWASQTTFISLMAKNLRILAKGLQCTTQ